MCPKRDKISVAVSDILISWKTAKEPRRNSGIFLWMGVMRWCRQNRRSRASIQAARNLCRQEPSIVISIRQCIRRKCDQLQEEDTALRGEKPVRCFFRHTLCVKSASCRASTWRRRWLITLSRIEAIRSFSGIRVTGEHYARGVMIRRRWRRIAIWSINTQILWYSDISIKMRMCYAASIQ